MAASGKATADTQSKVIEFFSGKYKCCAAKDCSVKVCIKCFSIYHKSCAERCTNFKIVDSNKIICCESEKQDSKEQEKVDKDNQCDLMKMEIKYLKKLTAEMEEKICIVKENNSLLKEKIAMLNQEIGNINKTNNIAVTKNVVKKGAEADILDKKLSVDDCQSKTIPTQKPEVKNLKENWCDIENQQMQIMQEIINLETPSSNMKSTPSNQLFQTSNNMNDNCSYKQALISNKVQNINDKPDVGNNKNKRIRKKVTNFGTAGTEDSGNKFVGKEINKKVWLFVSRVKDHVTEDNIKSYIINKADLKEDNDIVVERHKTKYDDVRKDCQCFKIGINIDKKDMVYDNKFWPDKVAFRRYDFKVRSTVADENSGDF